MVFVTLYGKKNEATSIGKRLDALIKASGSGDKHAFLRELSRLSELTRKIVSLYEKTVGYKAQTEPKRREFIRMVLSYGNVARFVWFVVIVIVWLLLQYLGIRLPPSILS